MKCSQCRTKNPPDSIFCSKCGTRIHPLEEIPSLTKTLKTPTRELAKGTLLAGRYEIIEELGRGGMGRVYKALDKEIEENVALKLLNPEIAADEKTIKRFHNELKFARKISHRNVCRMYDLRREEDAHYIIMEYVPGEDLKSLIRRAGALPVGKSISIAEQALEGLIEAHRIGVVHRDLKPQNIMIDEEDNVKIMDFGIARSLKARGITETGMIIGTPDYMSPEQVEAKEVDQRSDIYSLGVILYEMLTGQVPFVGETALSIALKHKTEIPQEPIELNPQLPSDLSQVILKCMDKKREKRHQSADELLLELRKIKKAIPEAIKAFPKEILEKEEKEEKNSIAVLSFMDLSPQRDQEYFCDGLAEELINALSHIQDLRVAARSSSFSYKGKDIDVREVGKKLNVQTVLEGSVRKAGNRLRITAQLINVADGYHLWSEKYDRDMEDIFAIQDEISLAIVEKLKVKLLKGEKTRLIKRHTENKEAFNLYLKGRYFWNRRHEGDMLRAIEFYKQALEKDPQYALPYVGIADVFNVFGVWAFMPPKEACSKAKEALERAIAIDDTIGEAYTSMAFFNFLHEWDWPTAEKNYKKGIELNPNNAYAHAWYAVALVAIKRPDQAIPEANKALELEPLSPIINALQGVIIGRMGQVDKGRERLNKTLEMEPNLPMAHLWLGMLYLFPEPDYKKAITHFQKAADFRMIFALGYLGWAYALSGKKDEALKILDRLDKLSEKKYVSPLLRAMIYFGLDKLDEAFEHLEKSYQVRDYFFLFINDPPLTSEVLSDPRFLALMKKTVLGEKLK